MCGQAGRFFLIGTGDLGNQTTMETWKIVPVWTRLMEDGMIAIV